MESPEAGLADRGRKTRSKEWDKKEVKRLLRHVQGTGALLQFRRRNEPTPEHVSLWLLALYPVP